MLYLVSYEPPRLLELDIYLKEVRSNSWFLALSFPLSQDVHGFLRVVHADGTLQCWNSASHEDIVKFFVSEN